MKTFVATNEKDQVDTVYYDLGMAMLSQQPKIHAFDENGDKVAVFILNPYMGLYTRTIVKEVA